MSDTPRSDAIPFVETECGDYLSMQGLDLARDLERENAKLRAALQRVADHCDKPSLVFDLANDGLNEV